MNNSALKVSREVIEACKNMAGAGLVAGTWGNASARVEEQGFTITPSGMSYSELGVSDMVVMDLSGAVVEGKRRPSTEYSLHKEIYCSRPDVHAVMHTHSTYACAFAVARKELSPVLEEQAQLVGGKVEVAEYAPAGSTELAGAAVRALGEKGAVFLANHGLVGVGKNIQEALLVCQIVEKSCRVNFISSMIGNPVYLSEEEVQQLRKMFVESYGQK